MYGEPDSCAPVGDQTIVPQFLMEDFLNHQDMLQLKSCKNFLVATMRQNGRIGRAALRIVTWCRMRPWYYCQIGWVIYDFVFKCSLHFRTRAFPRFPTRSHNRSHPRSPYHPPSRLQATTPSEIWLRDLDALGDVLDEIAQAKAKQELEDAKQRKNAGKKKVWFAESGECGNSSKFVSDRIIAGLTERCRRIWLVESISYTLSPCTLLCNMFTP